MAPIPVSATAAAAATATETDTQEPSATSFPLRECLAYTRYIPIIIIVMSALYGCVYCLKGVQMQLRRREKSKWSGLLREERALDAVPMGFRKPRKQQPHPPPPSLVAPNEEEDDHHHQHRPSTSTTVWVDDNPRQKFPVVLASWCWKWLDEKRRRQRQWSVASGSFREYPHGRHMQNLVNHCLQQLHEEEEEEEEEEQHSHDGRTHPQ